MFKARITLNLTYLGSSESIVEQAWIRVSDCLKSFQIWSIPGPSVSEFAMVFWKYGYASMPTQSQAAETALLEPLTQAVQVSTWPIGVPLKAVPESD